MKTFHFILLLLVTALVPINAQTEETSQGPRGVVNKAGNSGGDNVVVKESGEIIATLGAKRVDPAARAQHDAEHRRLDLEIAELKAETEWLEAHLRADKQEHEALDRDEKRLHADGKSSREELEAFNAKAQAYNERHREVSNRLDIYSPKASALYKRWTEHVEKFKDLPGLNHPAPPLLLPAH